METLNSITWIILDRAVQFIIVGVIISGCQHGLDHKLTLVVSATDESSEVCEYLPFVLMLVNLLHCML